MNRDAHLVNTARGKICDRDDIVRALKTGQLAGYAATFGSVSLRPMITRGAACRITG